MDVNKNNKNMTPGSKIERRTEIPKAKLAMKPVNPYATPARIRLKDIGDMGK